jgi:hypothetical protein
VRAQRVAAGDLSAGFTVVLLLTRSRSPPRVPSERLARAFNGRRFRADNWSPTRWRGRTGDTERSSPRRLSFRYSQDPRKNQITTTDAKIFRAPLDFSPEPSVVTLYSVIRLQTAMKPARFIQLSSLRSTGRHWSCAAMSAQTTTARLRSEPGNIQPDYANLSGSGVT